ncbi:hypothetical protein WDW86_09805 [Bdellovibrionota bacterium FG-2]
MSHHDILYHLLDRTEARKLLAKFFSFYKEGKAFIHLTDHFKKRCLGRNVSLNDAVNVMKAGSFCKQGEADIRSGQIVYNVETERMAVAFQFLDENRIRLITVKRK